MREYTVEVTNDEDFEQRCRLIRPILAKNASEALAKARPQLKPGEFVYQVTRRFADCELEQPVYDYFNGLELFREHDARDTWQEE